MAFRVERTQFRPCSAIDKAWPWQTITCSSTSPLNWAIAFLRPLGLYKVARLHRVDGVFVTQRHGHAGGRRARSTTSHGYTVG
jgi:hypothetical protein